MTRSLPTIMECTGGPTSRAMTEKIAWYMKRLPGPFRGAGIQLLLLRYADVEEHPLKLENEDWCLTSALINILMMLSKPLQKTFLYSIDTLGQVIDENPVFSPPLACYLSTICCTWSSPGDARSWSQKLWLISRKLTNWNYILYIQC